MGTINVNSIRVIPELRTVDIRNIGVWKRADLYFDPGLNLITGRSRTGKTTLLDALYAAISGTLNPSYLKGHKNSQIMMKLRNKDLELKPLRKKPVVSIKDTEITSQQLMRILRRIIAAVPKGYAVLMDEDIFKNVDEFTFIKTMHMLIQSKRQVIVATRRMVKIIDVQIFECLFDPKTRTSKINDFKYNRFCSEEE